MKNIQIIDGARNCTFSIYAATEAEFFLVFPAPGQDVEFADDFFERIGDASAKPICDALWTRPVDKKQVQGIHGTLFYGLPERKPMYPTKREAEMVVVI